MFNKIKEFFEKIDLSKKYPGYFNKWLIRGAFGVLIVLYLFLMSQNNWSTTTAYFICEIDSKVDCKNPFYDINNNHPNCINGLCTHATVNPGETLGKPPSFLFENFNIISFWILVLIFGINHLLYWRKQKNAIF